MFSGALEVAGDCKAGWHCKHREDCPAFKEEQANMAALPTLSSPWLALVTQLAQLNCEGEENGVCCKSLENERLFRTKTKRSFDLMFAGECKLGWQCRQREECPAFNAEQANLETLTLLTPEWLNLVSTLKDLQCNGEKNWVCCETKRELGDFLDAMASSALTPVQTIVHSST